MSKRHRWGHTRGRSRDWAMTWICFECFMRRRWWAGPRCDIYGMASRHWEYLPVSVSGWQHAQRTCGPCPGKGGA